MARLDSIDDLDRLASELAARDEQAKAVVRMCMTGCRALGAVSVFEAFERELANAGLADQVRLVKTGQRCYGD